jgi:hypothetical protein
MAGLAIFQLGLKLLLRKGGGLLFFRFTRCDENDCENCRVQQGLQINGFHDPASEPSFGVNAQRTFLQFKGHRT